MILAEASNESMGAFVYALMALLGGAAAGVSIWAMTRKKSTVEIEPQPIETRRAAKRFNHDLAEQRHADHERRLLDLETWRAGLIEKLEDDKNEILRAGDARKDELQTQINELPGKIVADLLNTRKLFGDK